MPVFKISNLTKRTSFEGYKENIEVLEAYIKCWFEGYKENIEATKRILSSLNLLDIQTPTIRDAMLKGRAPQTHVNCWEDHLFHDHQRSKIVLHYQPPKLNTYPLVVVVHKYFG